MNKRTQTVEILRALAEAELRVAETLFVQNNTDLSLRSAALIKYEALRDIANRINDEQDQEIQP